MTAFLSKNKKSGIWYLWYKQENGKMNKVSSKTTDDIEAEIFKKTYILKHQAPDTNINSSVITFLEYRDIFINRYQESCTSGTVELYKQTFKFLYQIIKNKPLNLISSQDIDAYKQMKLKTAKKVTINIDLRNIKTFLNNAIADGYLQKNIMNNDNIFFTIDEKPIKYFSQNEIKKVFKKIPNEFLKNIYKFALLTGMRLNEIMYLQYGDIDLDNNLIKVNNKESFRTKTGKCRNIPLTKTIKELIPDLNEYKNKENRYVFGKGKHKYSPYDGNYISRRFKLYLRKVGILNSLNFHCLRHTFITNLIKIGTPINYVKELAGHSNIQTTMNYIHISTEDLRNSMNNLKYDF